MTNKIHIAIPISLIQDAIDSGVIQTHGTPRSADLRWDEVQRRQYHFSEIVISIIIKELENQRRLQYNPNLWQNFKK